MRNVHSNFAENESNNSSSDSVASNKKKRITKRTAGLIGDMKSADYYEKKIKHLNKLIAGNQSQGAVVNNSAFSTPASPLSSSSLVDVNDERIRLELDDEENDEFMSSYEDDDSNSQSEYDEDEAEDEEEEAYESKEGIEENEDI